MKKLLIAALITACSSNKTISSQCGLSDASSNKMPAEASFFDSGQKEEAGIKYDSGNDAKSKLLISTKKGIANTGLNPQSQIQTRNAIQALNVSWWYNYSVTPWARWDYSKTNIATYGSMYGVPLEDPGPNLPDTDATFVPMIASQGHLNNQEIAWATPWAKKAGAILAFNEPYNYGEANMTVDQAIADWPKLEALGVRLGVPAGGGNEPWITEFITKAKAAGLRLDFLVCHWNVFNSGGWNNVGLRENFAINLTACERWGLPVWYDEIDYIGTLPAGWEYPTQADMLNFMTNAVAYLEKDPKVERYAFWPVGTVPQPGTTGGYDGASGITTTISMSNPDGTLTKTGIAYSNLAIGNDQ